MGKNKIQQKLTREDFFRGLAIIAKYLKPHRRLIYIMIFFSLISASAEAFIPFVAGKIFDAIIGLTENPNVSIAAIFYIIAFWLALRVAGDVINWRMGYSNERLAVQLDTEYIANGIGRLMEMPLSFHKERKQGEITDRITRAAGRLETLASRVLVQLLPNFLSIGIAFALTSFINFRLTLILAVSVAIYVVLLWRSVPELAGLSRKMHGAYNRAYGDAYDAIGNIQEIKQAATEKHEKKKIYRKFVNEAGALWLRMSYIYRKIDFFQRFLIAATQLTIFIVSVYMVKNGTLTPGQLVAFNGYAAMMFGPFVVLGHNWDVIQNGLVALVKAEKILTAPTEIYQPKGAVAPEKLKGDIEFIDVSFSYKANEPILKEVSFKVGSGQKIALVGKSGVGKTTIADLILGFHFPQKGRILIDGVDIRKYDLSAYRGRIGVVPQEPTLFNDTIGNNIRYGNFEKSSAELKEAVRLAHAEEFIEKFPKKYKQLVGWRGIKLSIGQKQRVALARAFLRNPDILILDEPTSALDAKSEQLIKDSLKKLMIGRTTLIIAHRFSTIREADKILVLEEGRIAEQGGHKELMKIKNGVYRELHDLQVGLN